FAPPGGDAAEPPAHRRAQRLARSPLAGARNPERRRPPTLRARLGTGGGSCTRSLAQQRSPPSIERNLPLANADPDVRASGECAFQDALSQWVLHQALQATLDRARAEGGIVAGLRQVGARLRQKLDGERLLAQQPLQPGKLEVDDLLDLGPAQRRELDDLV